MGIRHPKLEELQRLREKTLDEQFIHDLRTDLDCSPIEARAILATVKDTYFPFLEEHQALRPGQICLQAIALEEPAGKPLGACAKRTIRLTVHRGADDDRLLMADGPTAFRRARIPALLQEALDQDAVLTREDLAYHVFHVCTRTISYDLQALRRQTPPPALPLRGTVHDIGPVLTHRVQIITLALQGRTTTEIQHALCHTPEAIANYLALFRRTAYLAQRGLQPEEMAFLLHRSPALITRYYALWQQYHQDPRLAVLLGESPASGEPEKGAVCQGR